MIDRNFIGCWGNQRTCLIAEVSAEVNTFQRPAVKLAVVGLSGTSYGAMISRPGAKAGAR
jgi:hypothetical protein